MTTREDEMVAELRELKKGWVTSQSFSKFIDRVIDRITALSSERDGLREALERARGMICCSVASVDSTMRPLYDEADRQAVLDKIDAALTGSASPR